MRLITRWAPPRATSFLVARGKVVESLMKMVHLSPSKRPAKPTSRYCRERADWHSGWAVSRGPRAARSGRRESRRCRRLRGRRVQASGDFLREISGAGVPGGFSPRNVTVDPTTKDLLVTSAHLIDEFSPSGTYLGQIDGSETPAGSFEELDGLAVNSSGYLYVVEETINCNGSNPLRQRVGVYSSSFILPKVSYPGVSNATKTTVTLNARVDPAGGGQVETCKFEYVDQSEYGTLAANPFSAGHTVPCAQSVPFSGPSEVSAEIGPLSPGTAYRYRVLAGIS